MKEGGWGTFNLAERNQLTQENDKKERSQQVEPRSLGEGKNKCQPPRNPQNGKVSEKLLKKEPQKEENNEE